VLRDIKEALRLSPDDFNWQVRQVQTLLHLGRNDEALSIYNRLKITNPGDLRIQTLASTLTKIYPSTQSSMKKTTSIYKLTAADKTDVGRQRDQNEDCAYKRIEASEEGDCGLFIVADGEKPYGEVASRLTVEVISRALDSFFKPLPEHAVKKLYYEDESSNDIASSLLHAIQEANASLYKNILESGATERSMGTTCIAAVLHGANAYVANVGDSRAYLIRQGQVRQVSQDHSWVAEQVRAGLLTEEQARVHGQRNVITRCMGAHSDVEVDVFTETVQEGDVLVLCTDGLSGVVSDEEIGSIVQQYEPEESVEQLIAHANEKGGPVNITAVVARISPIKS